MYSKLCYLAFHDGVSAAQEAKVGILKVVRNSYAVIILTEARFNVTCN